MKIQIEEMTYSGSAAEILEQLRSEAFDPDAFPDTEHYLRYVRDNVVRSTGQVLDLPNGDLETRARALITHLSSLGGLMILEDADGR